MQSYDEKQTALEAVLSYYGIFVESAKFKIVCPFHGDVNASLLIDLETASWFCFGCSKGGDAKDFVKGMEHCDDFNAYIILNKILSKHRGAPKIKVHRISKAKSERLKKRYLSISKDYYFNLKTVRWKRSLNEDEQICLKYMQDRGFDSKALDGCGAKATYNTNYPIIFPMYDMGEFKGYVCRTMDKKVEEKRKYLYNKGFSRRDTLVGKYNCKTVMVVEGYMDYLKAKQFGMKFVTPLLGWKATTEQIQKLKDAGVTTIISALDNDECGRKGTAFLRLHFDVIRFRYLKGVKDIGEMNIETFNKCKHKTIDWRKNNGIGITKQDEKRNK